MSIVAAVKWIAESGPIPRVEKLVSVGVVTGLNYLAKCAHKRGDFHEANHNIAALIAGDSMHDHGDACTIPGDRMLEQVELAGLAAKFKAQAQETADVPMGLYL